MREILEASGDSLQLHPIVSDRDAIIKTRVDSFTGILEQEEDEEYLRYNYTESFNMIGECGSYD